VISFAVVAACSQELAGLHRRALHTVLAQSPAEVAVPMAVDMGAAGVVHMAAVHKEAEVAGPIVVHIEMGVARKVAGVAHTEVAAMDLVAGLDRMTWVLPSCRILVFPSWKTLCNVQYHTTGVEANRQVITSLTKVDIYY
jgi:hypothetical protein